MANPEHLAILKEGVVPWNKWRKEHSNIFPDLSGADIGETLLEKANLNGTNLFQAKLQGSRLGEANLQMASLIEANLSRAPDGPHWGHN